MGLFNFRKKIDNRAEEQEICDMRKKISEKFSQLNEFLDNNKCIDHIVLIDDDDTSNFVTETTLKSYGVGNKISVFADPFKALDFIKDLKEDGSKMPEMIFLDIKMPLMSGFEFLDRCNDFCNIEDETKIIVLSSSAYSKDKDNALKRGLDYITKPLQAEYLKEYID